MIKINIDYSALEDYFNLLNPTVKNINKREHKYNKKESLIGKIYKKSIEKNSLSDFYKFILDQKNDFKFLKEIILSTPVDLELNIISKIEEFCKNRCILFYNPNDKNREEEFKNIIDTFGYINLRNNIDIYSIVKKDENKKIKSKAEWIYKKLNVKVCPYCNRVYTLKIDLTKEEEKIKLLFDFDHFFNKSRYPYLSVSFYNLIPSCSICNTHFKRDIEFSVEKNIHPYLGGFNKEVTFTLNTTDATFAEGNPNKKNYQISFKNIEKYPKEKKNNEIFKLDVIYNEHKDYVDELIKKFYIYNDIRINDLLNQYGTLFKSKDELINTIFCNYIQEDSLDKRPLAKLTKDIYEELKELSNLKRGTNE